MAQPIVPTPRIYPNSVCLACGCLCDDIALEVDGDRIVRAQAACPIGERWFLAQRTRDRPSCAVSGHPVALAEGVARAAKILAAAKHPLYFGLAGTTCEAQRAAVALADRTGGILIAGNEATCALAAAIESVGIVSATLGEVRHRADVVLFWGVDPPATHPRHFERYSLNSTGRFVPQSRADRTCIVVDSRRTATADEADLFLQIQPGSSSSAIAALHTILNGNDAIDGNAIEQQTGAPFSQWREIVDRLKAARYGAIFFDPTTFTTATIATDGTSSSALETLLLFVRELNQHTRCVALTMGTAGNATGAEQVLSWQTGFPAGVDFRNRGPTSDAAEYSIARATLADQADAALIVASDPIADPWMSLSDAARERLQTMPLIVLHTVDSDPAAGAKVTFTVSTPGINRGGTVFRSDGVSLPLRGAIDSPYPPADSILRRIVERLNERTETTSYTRSAAANTSANGTCPN